MKNLTVWGVFWSLWLSYSVALMVEFIVEADKLVNTDGFKRGRFDGVSKSSGVRDDTAGSLPVALPMVRIMTDGLGTEN